MRWLLVLTLLGCGPRPTEPAPQRVPPTDHTPLFRIDHSHQSGCETCHGVDSCSRCHAGRPPADHRADFSAGGHGYQAAVDGDRCATCHTPVICARCHQ